MIICGIDLSTKSIAFGFIFEDGADLYHEVIAKGNKAVDRFQELMTETYIYLYRVRPSHVYVEDIPYVKNARSELDLAAVLGGVRALCVALSIPYTIVHNLTWKKTLGLKKPNKDDIRVEVTKRLSLSEDLSQNIIDALGICLHGLESSAKKNASENTI